MKKSNYVQHPVIDIKGVDEKVINGWDNIIATIKDEKTIICDLYPGVDKNEVIENMLKLNPSLIIDTDYLLKDKAELDKALFDYITTDRVFGFMCHKTIDYCFDKDKVENAKEQIKLASGKVIVVGPGATLVEDKGILLYFDISRWEVQLRYRKGMSNWLFDNSEEPILSKYKRGFFVEWRMADKHKMSILDSISYFVDTHTPFKAKMISGSAIIEGLNQTVYRPFRMEPYFDAGVWGGFWMKEKFDLPEGTKNYAWSFDGVPEENCINLGFNGGDIKLPAIDLVLYKPHELLGEKVHGRYGAEFPIRFDLLDTMGGQNLSLQVHPLTEYIQQNFGMNYTQDESYYILDTEDDGVVYLGSKTGIDKDEMLADLKRAEKGEIVFDAEKYVNKFKAHKHDHFLIPGGTLHCSGANTMVLEISATPYIFTFKQWDWSRLGLDGLPRPVHLAHGSKNIQWDRNTEWVKANLVDQVQVLEKTDDYLIEKTGLHKREPIITKRYTTSTSVVVEMNDSVNMLNLVDGDAALVESLDNSFEPFEVHYAETFIVPAICKQYRLSAIDGREIKVLCAEIR